MKINIQNNIMYITAEDNMYLTQNSIDITIQNRYYSKQIIVSSKCDSNIFRDASQEEKDQYDIDLEEYKKSLEIVIDPEETHFVEAQEVN